jgi:hypothetical protein
MKEGEEIPEEEIISISLPLAWNMPNPASEIVRPSSTVTTSSH